MVTEIEPQDVQIRKLAPKSPALDKSQLPEIELEGPSEPESHEYPTGLKLWLIILTMAALLILGGLDTNIVATAVPSITDHFHTVADVGWYSSAFRLCSCVFQFVFGKLYKLFSIKVIFLFAQAIFLIGSILCSTATSSSMFIAGRAVTGTAFAGILGGLFTILVYILPLHKRPIYCGVFGMVEGLAVLAAPIVGGALTESLSWRWCFWINLPIGGISILMTLFLFSDPKPSDKTKSLKQKLYELDLVSNLLFIPALTSLFLALSWGGTKYSWSDGKIIGPLVTFVVLLVPFAYNQYRRGDTATLPPRIITNRSVIAGAIFGLCSNSTTNVLEYYLPSYYQVVRNYSPSTSGYMMTPMVIGSTIGMLICGSGTSTIGYYTPFMLFSSALLPIFTGLITTFGADTSLVQLILFTGVCGFGVGVGYNAPMSAAQTALPTDDVSLGLSILLFAQNLGPAVFIAIAQVIFTNELASSLGKIVPGISPASITSSGLSDIVDRATTDGHEEVLKSVARSFDETWYLAVGTASATLLGSLLMEWRSVKAKKA